METTEDFFQSFWSKVRKTLHWKTMENTVENSPWHREANVAVHTTMTIGKYMENFFHQRTERQRMMALMALLFHDFGKPEAEETLSKKDDQGNETGEMYRRYAGHEPISGNEFLSFMCDHDELREEFFAQGYAWKDIRAIKVMIEHHLPYGLKNEQKRQNLKHMIEFTLGEDEVCFYDMLRSDAAGRTSDDHATKLQNVEDWINEFQTVTYKPIVVKDGAPELILLVGVSGAGKSTYITQAQHSYAVKGVEPFEVYCEDDLRLKYANDFMDETDHYAMSTMTTQEKYDVCWRYCHMMKNSKFDQYSAEHLKRLLETGKTIVVDRMNQGRKARAKLIVAARQKGYKIRSVEFFISESKAKARQKTRPDKSLNDFKVHQICMQLETPWFGPEVDSFGIYIA